MIRIIKGSKISSENLKKSSSRGIIFRVKKLTNKASVDMRGDLFSRVCGAFDHNIKTIEKEFGVQLVYRDDKLTALGEEPNVKKALFVVDELCGIAKKEGDISEQKLLYAIELSNEENGRVSAADMDPKIICHTTAGKPIMPKTFGQQNYVDLMKEKMIVFGTGPAGTGKTYLAMAMAITAFKNDEVSRIILTRPAIEAGEKLGFLPGDLQSKVDPYLRPLYDALYQIMGAEVFERNVQKGLIEVAPLAYMRGRTLDDAYIILDEAQNTTPAQMKMFLTRIGFGSKVVVTGDETQKDLSPGTVSGLTDALNILRGIDEIGVCRLTAKDVVRHPLVQRIVKAYELNENKNTKKSARSVKNKKPDKH